MNNLRQRLSSFMRRYTHITNTPAVTKVLGWTLHGCHTLSIDGVTSANHQEHKQGGLVIANCNDRIGVAGIDNNSKQCQFRLWQLNDNNPFHKVFCLESVAYDKHYLRWDISSQRVNLMKITEDDKKSEASNICWSLPTSEANPQHPKYLLQAYGSHTDGSHLYLVFDFANQLVKDSPIEAFLLHDRARAVTNAAITFTPPISPQ